MRTPSDQLSTDLARAPLTTADRVLLGLLYGAVAPVVLFLAGWWLSLPFVAGPAILVAALAGLVLGLLVDAALLAAQYRVTGFAARLTRRGTGALAQDGRPT